MKTKYEIIDRIIEYGIYLYIIFMFLTKGEGIRNIVIFGNFGLWLFTIKYRKNLYLLKEPVSLLFWLFLGIIVFSVIFSIDPFYSLLELGSAPRKAILLFPVITTVMAEEKKLKRVVYVSLFTAVGIVLIAYYSYFFHGFTIKINTQLMYVWNNKFAGYLNTLLSFSFILYFIWKKPGLKALLTFTFVISIFALILSTSRGGYLAFFSIAVIWAIYISKTKDYNFIKIISVSMAVITLVGALSWFSIPYVKERISKTAEDVYTLNERTVAWKASIYAFRQRPLFGWGYGKQIFHKDEPFKNTPFKKRPYYRDLHPFDDPHNIFIKFLFHQGIIGFISYVFLILIAIKVFWKEAFKTTGIKSYVLVACVSVIIGFYIFHSMLTIFQLHYLAVILGLGMAAKGIDENSHS
ncbi:MAG: O-antigen ligase family protein [Thermodesulfovibrionia bacterium]|nr:O-antigen ligase family protein [Thermodesulfovibrionia bacterium]